MRTLVLAALAMALAGCSPAAWMLMEGGVLVGGILCDVAAGCG